VDEVLEALQKLVPSARIAASDRGFERLGIRRVTFDHLDGLDYEVCYWLIARLCELGWEPFDGLESPGIRLRKRYRTMDSTAR
jgi:hypothetical protein